LLLLVRQLHRVVQSKAFTWLVVFFAQQ
jgi:hypothetical protein